MAPLVGEEDEETIVFVETYWDKLSSWEFILTSLSIARAIDFNFNKDDSWQKIIELDVQVFLFKPLLASFLLLSRCLHGDLTKVSVPNGRYLDRSYVFWMVLMQTVP